MAATGKIGMIGPDCVKEGAIVIDVGISRGEDGAIHGDVQFDEISDIAAMATPVPGGVGAHARSRAHHDCEAAFALPAGKEGRVRH